MWFRLIFPDAKIQGCQYVRLVLPNSQPFSWIWFVLPVLTPGFPNPVRLWLADLTSDSMNRVKIPKPEWEFIKGNKKVRKKKENTLSTKKATKRNDQEKKKVLFFFSWKLFWSRAYFLSFFLFLSLSWSKAVSFYFFYEFPPQSRLIDCNASTDVILILLKHTHTQRVRERERERERERDVNLTLVLHAKLGFREDDSGFNGIVTA